MSSKGDPHRNWNKVLFLPSLLKIYLTALLKSLLLLESLPYYRVHKDLSKDNRRNRERLSTNNNSGSLLLSISLSLYLYLYLSVFFFIPFVLDFRSLFIDRDRLSDKSLHHPSDKTFQSNKVFWMKRLILKYPFSCAKRCIYISSSYPATFPYAMWQKSFWEKTL